LAYGPNLLSLHQLTGVLAGKVLRGANPGELPIERPTKLETVLNMRTARALVITIPTSLLLRADEASSSGPFCCTCSGLLLGTFSDMSATDQVRPEDLLRFNCCGRLYSGYSGFAQQLPTG
jgi:ABC transporter substrate binding protein